MNCSQCSAPLPAKSNLCRYCGALNDIDLRALQNAVRQGSASAKACPRCDRPLMTINLGCGQPVWLERCPNCLGMFFDPGELNMVLRQCVAEVEEIDLQRLTRIIEEESVSDYHRVKYVKCPVCRDLMVRKSHGTRSGVITDVCRPHGVWLDGGELGQLFKWVRAGGPQLDRERRAERRGSSRSKRSGDVVRWDWSAGDDQDAATGTLRGLLGVLWNIID